MSFFGGFTKGFADGYNADIAAKKAAELERTKYLSQLELKNRLEIDQATTLNTIDFGNIVDKNGGVLFNNFSYTKDFNETNQLKKSFNNQNNLALALSTKNENGVSPQDILLSAPDANAAVIDKIKKSYTPDDIYIKDQLGKQTENQLFEFDPDLLGYSNNPLLKTFDMFNAVDKHNNNNNQKIDITGSSIHDSFKGSVRKDKTSFYEENQVKDFVKRANVRTGRDVIGEIASSKQALKQFGLKHADPVKVISLGMRLEGLLKGDVNAQELDLAIKKLREEKYYGNISLIDLQTAISLNLANEKSIVRKDGMYIVRTLMPSYKEVVEASGRELQDTKTAYKKASDVYNRVERTLGLIEDMESEGNAVPTGIFQSVEIAVRGIADVGNQTKTIVNSLMNFVSSAFGTGAVPKSFYNTASEGRTDQVTAAVYDEMQKAYESAGLGTIDKLKKDYLDKGMSEEAFYKTLNEMSRMDKKNRNGYEITSSDYDKIEASNTALIQYHGYLLAFDMAAAIQGGGDSRTISDKDVRIMQKAIAGALKSGADYKSVLREIQRNMDSARQYHQVYLHADLNSSKQKLKSADILTDGFLSNNFTGYVRQVANNISDSSSTKRVGNGEVPPVVQKQKIDTVVLDGIKTEEFSKRIGFTKQQLFGQNNLDSWARMTVAEIGRMQEDNKGTKYIEENIKDVYNIFARSGIEDNAIDQFPLLFPESYQEKIKLIINEGNE